MINVCTQYVLQLDCDEERFPDEQWRQQQERED